MRAGSARRLAMVAAAGVMLPARPGGPGPRPATGTAARARRRGGHRHRRGDQARPPGPGGGRRHPRLRRGQGGGQPAPGHRTALPSEGAVVTRGKALYRVDGRPVPLLYGRLPAWRTCRSGSTTAPTSASWSRTWSPSAMTPTGPSPSTTTSPGRPGRGAAPPGGARPGGDRHVRARHRRLAARTGPGGRASRRLPAAPPGPARRCCG